MFISSPRERIAQIIALLVVLIILGMYIKSIVNDPTMAIMAIPVVFALVGLFLCGKYKENNVGEMKVHFASYAKWNREILAFSLYF